MSLEATLRGPLSIRRTYQDVETYPHVFIIPPLFNNISFVIHRVVFRDVFSTIRTHYLVVAGKLPIANVAEYAHISREG